MIRRWLALTYYLYALRLAALSHFYFNPLYLPSGTDVLPNDAVIKKSQRIRVGIFGFQAETFAKSSSLVHFFAMRFSNA